VNGVAWVHAMSGDSSPMDSPIVQVTLGGLRRKLAKPVNKKLLFTVEMLQLLAQDAQKQNMLASLRLAAACLLTFAGFLRFNELAEVKLCDLAVGSDHLKLYICHSKTDQFRQGKEVVIARTGTCTCPVAMLEAYMAKGNIQPDATSTKKVFRPIVRGHADRLREDGGLAYSRMRELIKEKLEELGFPAVDFGLHSLRAGGATAAAVAGVPDRLFKKHGRWKSENAKDGYIEDSLQQRLSVTKNLGL